MARSAPKKRSSFSLGDWLKAIGLTARDIGHFPSAARPDDTEYRADAPAPHIDAILEAIEKVDKSVSPLMGLGMDAKVATLLKQIESSGAIIVRIEDNQIWIDMYDKKAAQAEVDKLKSQTKRPE